MESKKCNKCKEEKSLEEFSKDKTKKDGLNQKCKVCFKEYYKEYCKEYKVNKEKRKSINRKYHKANKEKRNIYTKEYNKVNRDKKNERAKKRRLTDPLYKLSENIRSLISYSFKNKGYKKTSKTHQILCCSFEELLTHLNDNHYGFTYGDKDLDIDHIIPLATATSEEEIIQLNHYTNLQLLPSEYNRDIKKANIFDKEDFITFLNIKATKINNLKHFKLTSV